MTGLDEDGNGTSNMITVFPIITMIQIAITKKTITMMTLIRAIKTIMLMMSIRIIITTKICK